MSEQKVKVIMEITTEKGVETRVFLAAGDSVSYVRNDRVEQRPPHFQNPTPAWPKKRTSTHTVEWETVHFE